MKAFQLLKSGASFKKDRVGKVERLFKDSNDAGSSKKPQSKLSVKSMKPDEDDSKILDFDQKLELNKTATKEA